MNAALLPAVLASGVCAFAVWGLTGPFREFLLRHGVCDVPNRRSSHSSPVPRGGGLALLAVAVPAWGLAGLLSESPGALWPVLTIALVLGAISFADDFSGLPPLPRFAAHVLAVASGIAVFDGGAVFQGLVPLWLDRALAAVAWLWFVNLFNFMDGVDGISAVETIAIGVGLALVAVLAGGPASALVLPLLLAGAAAGFLAWNWSPARVFLGDSGSIPLGFLLGWLLLEAAARGQWAVALILPAYYLADATLTLMRRALRGERLWNAHREHAYQRAVQAGRSHAEVAGVVGLADAVLVGCAVVATLGRPWPALVAAAFVVGLVLWGFTRQKSA